MPHKKILLFALIAAALLLQACGPSTADAIATGLAQTLQVSLLETAAAGGGNAAQPTEAAPQETATSSNTPLPESTATSSIPFVSVSVDTHCRSGPRLDYKLLTTVLIGEEVQVLAVYPAADYVVVMRPGGAGNCWLWLRYADRTDFSGYNLPVATMPPTSTPTFTPSPTYTPTATYTPTPTP